MAAGLKCRNFLLIDQTLIELKIGWHLPPSLPPQTQVDLAPVSLFGADGD